MKTMQNISDDQIFLPGDEGYISAPCALTMKSSTLKYACEPNDSWKYFRFRQTKKGQLRCCLLLFSVFTWQFFALLYIHFHDVHISRYRNIYQAVLVQESTIISIIIVSAYIIISSIIVILVVGVVVLFHLFSGAYSFLSGSQPET